MSDKHEQVTTLALNDMAPMSIIFYQIKTQIPEIPHGYGYGDRF